MIFVIILIIIIFLLNYYNYYYNYYKVHLEINKTKINYKAYKIIKHFCMYKSNEPITIILLIGQNKKNINKYIKIIANFYHKQVFTCDLHKIYNTNEIKELFFHKIYINFHNKFYCIHINKRLYVFNHDNYKDYNDYINELTRILMLLNEFNTKLIFIFIINKHCSNLNSNSKNLQIYLHKHHYNCITYNHKSKTKYFYYY